jgi:anti-sigma B factor antagonist
MGLAIETTIREGITLVRATGQIVAGETVGDLRECVRTVSTSAQPNMIVDLEHVDYIDSTGLGALVMSHTLTERAGGKMKLVHLKRRSMELLVLTKLDTVFEVFDDEQEAINSFFPDRASRKFDILAFVKQARKEAK